MVDRVDLLIAVIGVVISVVGSSTALWMALAKKADREDVARVEGRLDAKIDAVEFRLGTRIDGLGSKVDRLDSKVDRLESTVDTRFGRLETKLDALILRLAAPSSPSP